MSTKNSEIVTMMTPTQMRMARAALQWGVRDVAKKAVVGINTVTRIENGGDYRASTLAELQKTYEKAGIVFGADGSVRLEKRGRK